MNEQIGLFQLESETISQPPSRHASPAKQAVAA
jgi:hypothetical protein